MFEKHASSRLCKAGQWTKIISNFGTGYPKNFSVHIVTVDGSRVAGEYCERRYLWIAPQKPVTGALQLEMHFRRHWINGIYSVAIKPETDVTVNVK